MAHLKPAINQDGRHRHNLSTQVTHGSFSTAMPHSAPSVQSDAIEARMRQPLAITGLSGRVTGK